MKRALTMFFANVVIFMVVQAILEAMKHYDSTCFLITVIGTSTVITLNTIINQYWQD